MKRPLAYFSDIKLDIDLKPWIRSRGPLRALKQHVQQAGKSGSLRLAHDVLGSPSWVSAACTVTKALVFTDLDPGAHYRAHQHREVNYLHLQLPDTWSRCGRRVS